MNETTVAVIGGGFTGLCVTSNLIRLLRKKKKFAAITIFEPNGNNGGRTFSTELPDNFRLNHETNFMGAVNPFSEETVELDDFYKWIQENKDKKLPSLQGDTITHHYKAFDITDPHAYLPRSLFGHYLTARCEELNAHPRSKYHKFTYKKASVTDIKETDGRFLVKWLNKEKQYDIVVLCTGFWYNKQDNCDVFYSGKNSLQLEKSKEIGIIGSSLSGIEIALSLADKGYTDITMFSRNGRLPKVRGRTQPYTPKYIKTATLEKLQDKYGYIRPSSLFPFLKAEFDFAYQQRGSGLYQKQGVNWKEILTNAHPIKQLEEDIRMCEQGEELVWRSVLSSFYAYEAHLWRNLNRTSRQQLLSDYGSFLLSYVGPIPLFQAKKLYRYLQQGAIKLVSDIKNHAYENGKYVITLRDNKRLVKDYLIDAKGPAKNIETMPLFNSLVTSGLLEKNPAGGVLVNRQLQIVAGTKVFNNMYAVGPMVYGQRPHNSSVFTTEYVEHIASYIVNSLDGGQDLQHDKYAHSQYDYLTSFTF